MTNYSIIFPGKGGDKQGSDVVATQNSILTDLVFECYYQDGTEYTFAAGDAITGFFQDKASLDDVYSVNGTLTPTTGENTFTWVRDATDTGQPGDYSLAFKVTSADADPDYSILVSYQITASPDGVLVPSTPLVGVPAADAAWLALAAAGTVTADTVQYNAAYVPTGAEPIAAQYWDSVNGEMAYVVDDDGAISIGRETWDKMTNLSGVQVVNGDVVSGVGATGNRQAFTLTDATNTASSLACIGMVTVPTINNNAPGRITKIGIVRGLDTSAFDEGAIVYVDPLNPGKLTQAQPQAPDFTIAVGVVTVKHASVGIINVNIRVVGKMVDMSDVNGTPLTASGQFLVWNDASKYFDATSNISDFDAAGAAAAAQAYAIQRANHTGTQLLATISDAGTMAAQATTSYYPKTDFSAAPTAAEPLKASGGGKIQLAGIGIGQAPSAIAVDIVGTNASQFRMSNTTADDTIKNAYWQVRHYSNEEQDVLAMLFQCVSDATATVYIGGGSSALNAVTSVNIATAPNATTLNGATVARFDNSITAGHTRFLIYDVDNGTLERVTVGAPDSGGAGYKVLRIPN